MWMSNYALLHKKITFPKKENLKATLFFCAEPFFKRYLKINKDEKNMPFFESLHRRMYVIYFQVVFFQL